MAPNVSLNDCINCFYSISNLVDNVMALEYRYDIKLPSGKYFTNCIHARTCVSDVYIWSRYRDTENFLKKDLKTRANNVFVP